jgi:hypothetical protein
MYGLMFRPVKLAPTKLRLTCTGKVRRGRWQGLDQGEPPWLHQLIVLSIGWAGLFHPALDPQLTNMVPQSTIFGCWPLVLFWVLAIFFSALTSIPSHLATQFTYCTSFPFLPTVKNPFTCLLCILSWLNLYHLTKCFSSWLNFYLSTNLFYCLATTLAINNSFLLHE